MHGEQEDASATEKVPPEQIAGSATLAAHDEPAGQSVCAVLATARLPQYLPATHAFDVGVVLPSARQKPAPHATGSALPEHE